MNNIVSTVAYYGTVALSDY